MWDAPIEWLIIAVIVLVLFGSAKKIPELARNLGRATGEFKRGQAELQNEIQKAFNSPAPTPKDGNSVNYVEVAKSMNIDTENKDTEQLKKEINEKLNSEQ